MKGRKFRKVIFDLRSSASSTDRFKRHKEKKKKKKKKKPRRNLLLIPVSIDNPLLSSPHTSHLIPLPEALPVHLLHPERVEIDPVDGPHVDGHFPLHELGRSEGVVEPVDEVDAAGRAEGVFGRFAGELVGGEDVGAVEADVFFGGVDP